MRGFLIKLLVGVVGIIVLIYFGSIDFGVLARAAGRPELLAVAFLCLLGTIPLAALRWWMLLKGLGIEVGFRWTLVVTSISLFFHTFLPGAYGGDLVRLGMAYRATGTGLNRLTLSIFTDRLTGLVALIILGLGMVPALPDVYAGRLELIAAIAAGAGAVGLVATLLWGDRMANLIQHLPAPVGPKLAHIVRELVGVLRAYVARPVMLSETIVLSLVQYALVLGSLMVLGAAIGIQGLSSTGYVVAGIWSLVANALPITPGGLGVGEAAFGQVAQNLAAPSFTAEAFGTVFLAMRVLSVIIGLVGVLPYFAYRREVRQSIASATTAPNRGYVEEVK